jgi:hypothetical protein
MDGFLQEAKARAERFGVKNIVVATVQGNTVREVRNEFGGPYTFFAVGNPAAAHERGLVYHDGTTPETKRELEGLGVRVVLMEQGPFQAVSIGGQGYDIGGQVPETVWQGAHKTFADWDFLGHLDQVVNKGLKGEANALWLISQTLGSLLGDGPSVCLEVTLMAADSGVLPLDSDCMAISRPRPASHAPDAALILCPQRTSRLLSGLRVKDVLLCPRQDDHWFCDKPLWPEG